MNTEEKSTKKSFLAPDWPNSRLPARFNAALPSYPVYPTFAAPGTIKISEYPTRAGVRGFLDAYRASNGTRRGLCRCRCQGRQAIVALSYQSGLARVTHDLYSGWRAVRCRCGRIKYHCVWIGRPLKSRGGEHKPILSFLAVSMLTRAQALADKAFRRAG